MLKVQPSTLRTPSCPRSPEWLCHLTRRVDSLKTGLTSSLPGLPHLAHGVRPSQIPNRKTQVAEPEIVSSMNLQALPRSEAYPHDNGAG